MPICSRAAPARKKTGSRKKKDDRKRWGGGVPALYGKEGEHMEAGLKQQFSIRLNYYALSGLLKHSAVSIQPTNQQLNTPKRHKG
ncbi:MAG: hypothetical protein ACFNUG_06695 [Tannerella forsythia]|uniref:hypothetical protein n=1 Tax=Tannerella forsythia TaxID=28112 RepID=UPI000868C7E0|nr:hypothetical protein [Tannerella forsythia]PDP71940.1 hypothetical protein CLI85_01725 [Tannerella forsythia]SCQ25020.1 hypothetical protein TFUB22_02320 [Tannerella forsythia]